jgi:hypothetical protein
MLGSANAHARINRPFPENGIEIKVLMKWKSCLMTLSASGVNLAVIGGRREAKGIEKERAAPRILQPIGVETTEISYSILLIPDEGAAGDADGISELNGLRPDTRAITLRPIGSHAFGADDRGLRQHSEHQGQQSGQRHRQRIPPLAV